MILLLDPSLKKGFPIVIEDDNEEFPFDPLYGVLETTNSISLYSLRLEKWPFHSIKVLNLKCRILEEKMK